jgi:hypothetical protein
MAHRVSAGMAAATASRACTVKVPFELEDVKLP